MSTTTPRSLPRAGALANLSLAAKIGAMVGVVVLTLVVVGLVNQVMSDRRTAVNSEYRQDVAVEAILLKLANRGSEHKSTVFVAALSGDIDGARTGYTEDTATVAGYFDELEAHDVTPEIDAAVRELRSAMTDYEAVVDTALTDIARDPSLTEQAWRSVDEGEDVIDDTMDDVRAVTEEAVTSTLAAASAMGRVTSLVLWLSVGPRHPARGRRRVPLYRLTAPPLVASLDGAGDPGRRRPPGPGRDRTHRRGRPDRYRGRLPRDPPARLAGPGRRPAPDSCSARPTR